jgi:hypothetical protein
MKIAVIHDGHYYHDEPTYCEPRELCEALDGLGHLAIHLDISNGSFISDLIYSGVDVAYISLGVKSAKWKKVSQILQTLQIPLLHEEYCLAHLFELLNPETTAHRRIQDNQYIYRSEYHRLVNTRGG